MSSPSLHARVVQLLSARDDDAVAPPDLDPSTPLQQLSTNYLQPWLITRGQEIASIIAASRDSSSPGGSHVSLDSDEFSRLTEAFHAGFALLDEISEETGEAHGLLHWKLTRLAAAGDEDEQLGKEAVMGGGDDGAVEMRIDVVTAAGESLATVMCSTCSTRIEDEQGRSVCLDCPGPARVYRCDACVDVDDDVTHAGHAWSRDTVHHLHRLTSIAGPTVAVSLSNALRAYADRPFLGEREPHGPGPGDLGAFAWVTVGEVGAFARCVAVGLSRVCRELVEGAGVRPVVGICGPNTATWVATDFACAMLGYLSIGLHQTFAAPELAQILNASGITTAVVCGAQLAKFVESAGTCDKLRCILVYDDLPEDWHGLSPPAHVTVSHLSDVMPELGTLDSSTAEQLEAKWTPPEVLAKPRPFSEADDVPSKCRHCRSAYSSAGHGFCNACFNGGVEEGADPALDEARAVVAQDDEARVDVINHAIAEQLPCTPDAPFTVIFTSGTTGLPKGIVETDRMWNQDMLVPSSIHPLIHVSYIPLSHSSDRLRVWQALMSGGRVGFCRYGSDRSGIDDLLDDIRTLRPTVLLAPPRIWNGLYSLFLQFLEEVQDEADGAPLTDELVFDGVRKFIESPHHGLGPRLQAINTGAAPTAPAVREFLRMWHLASEGRVAVSEGYATSETGSVAYNRCDVDGWAGLRLMELSEFTVRPSDGRMQRKVSLPELRLVDCPELGFFVADEPHARGELLIKSVCNTPGYFQRPEATTKSFTSDGFYRTGDICEIEGYRADHSYDPEDVVVRIIDRRAEVFKLAMGEKFSPSKLEGLYFGGRGEEQDEHLGAVSEALKQVVDLAIHGDPTENYVLAIVVLAGTPPEINEADVTLEAACAHVEPPELRDELVHDDTGAEDVAVARRCLVAAACRPKLVRSIHEALVALGRQNGLLQFELPHDVIFDTEPWSPQANGVRNSALKLNRRRLAAVYRKAIDAKYASLRRSFPDVPGL